jgi:hypothetical protein
MGPHEWFEARSLRAHLSVTDETDYAASFCVVEPDGAYGISATAIKI